MSRIFISYRRSDAAAEAGRIYDYLERYFGHEAVFKDVDVIDAGDDFRERINDAVGQCQVLLALIGKSWLQVTDEAGRRRLDNPADLVRLEIETALLRQILVIPLLLDGVAMPSVHDLPTTLEPLVDRNAARVRHDPDFRRDMDRVLGVIQREFSGSPRTVEQLKKQFSETPLPKVLLSKATRPENNLIHAQQLSGISKAIPRNDSKPISRRRFYQILAYSGAVLLGRVLLQGGDNWQLPNREPETIDGTTAEFNVATVNVSEKSIAVVRDRSEFVTEDLGDGVTLDLMEIPAGTFTMGSPASEVGRSEDEGPPHDVSVPSFWMGKYPVTQAQWRAVAALPKIEKDLDPSPARFSGDNRPVEQVSWWDAVEFCQRLSAKSGFEYRLPSEAEWEYACRAGTTTPFHIGETLTAELANYRATAVYSGGHKGHYRFFTIVVGSFPANAFGLYDMHGNVWEWCADHWPSNYDGAPGCN